MSEQPQGAGWWRASDGRYYPPQPERSTVATVHAPAEPPVVAADSTTVSRPPWRRWWFWLLVAVALLVSLGTLAWLIVGIGPSVSLAPVSTVDYSDQADRGDVVVGHVSSSVHDGRLLLTHLQSGSMYLTLEKVAPTDAVGISATSGWGATGMNPDYPARIGVLVLNAAVEGYAATCASDGSGQVWSVRVQETVLVSTVKDSGCSSTNTLTLDVVPSATGDLVTVTFPNGERAAFLPGSSRAPFVGLGIMASAWDGSVTPPQVAVTEYSVRLPR